MTVRNPAARANSIPTTPTFPTRTPGPQNRIGENPSTTAPFIATRDDSLAPVGTKTQASTPARSAPAPTSHPAAATATTTATATTLASTATHVRVRTFTEAYSPVVARKAVPSPEKASLPSSGVM